MKFLLDTHVFLWYVLGDARLSDRAKEIIDAHSGLNFSIVSLWEISIKVNIGKLQLNCSLEDLLSRLDYINAEILPITVEDTQTYASLPVIPGHRDPFDRILVTQAMNRCLLLMSADTKFNPDSTQRIWTSICIPRNSPDKTPINPRLGERMSPRRGGGGSPLGSLLIS